MQLCFLYNIGPARNPMIAFNPYCDQNYWLSKKNTSSFESKDYKYHPLLTFVNTNTILPSSLDSKQDHAFPKGAPDSEDIAVYGSSFTGHKLFKEVLQPLYKNINYAVPSYGIDQIYLSYKLSKNNHVGDTLVIGFLLEDIDRAVFYKRDYEKIKYARHGDEYSPTNVPIQLRKKRTFFEFYSFKIFKNIFSLVSNNFNPKNSNCLYKAKKDLFFYFLDDILDDAEKLNQKLIFISFNFAEDHINAGGNWREDLVVDYFSSKKDIIYINSKNILSSKIRGNDEIYRYFSSDDMHLNKEGFSLILSELKSNISER